jgi:hypothetical protein
MNVFRLREQLVGQYSQYVRSFIQIRDKRTGDHVTQRLDEGNREDTAYILDTFPIVKRKDEAKFGDYRTKRIILEIYDAMKSATDSGQPYQTLLNPPPADPRCCHPPRSR